VKDTEKIKVIAPRDDLGEVLLFSQERSAANIKLGYYDGLRYAKNLRGLAYYINPVDENEINMQIMSIPDNIILETGAILNIPEMPAKRMLFEKIIPQLSAYFKLGKDYDYADFIIAILERMAAKRKIKRFHIYDYNSLCDLVREQPVITKKKKELFPIPPLKTIGTKRKEAIDILGNSIFLS
jgi:NTE family protein